MEGLYLGRKEILEYQKNRDPYLFVEIADEVIPGISAKGYRNLREDDWFFECHFEGDPNMPGFLQAEALVQLGALSLVTLPGNKGEVVYLTKAEKMILRRKVLIGDRYDMAAKVISWKRGVGKFHAVSHVDGEKACEMKFDVVMPSILNKYRAINN